MMWFQNLKIGKKLLLSNSMLCLLMILIVGVLLQRLSMLGESVKRVDIMHNAVVSLLQSDRGLFQALVAERSLLNSRPGSEPFVNNLATYNENIKQSKDSATHFYGLFNDKYISIVYSEYEQYRFEWEELSAQILSERESDNSNITAVIDLSFGPSAEAFDKARGKLKEMLEYVNIIANKSSLDTTVSVNKTFMTVVTLTGLFVFVFISISILFPKMIVSPMRDLITRINELAGGGGDLTKKIDIQSEDEIGEMGHSVNNFIESLRLLLVQIITLGNQFAEQSKALEKLSNRNKKVTDGAMQETNLLATSITQMSASVHEVAQNANNAAAQAQQANDESQSGRRVD
jgi:methyl-accepting chemotaxis protein